MKARCCEHVPEDQVVLLPLDLVGGRCVACACMLPTVRWPALLGSGPADGVAVCFPAYHHCPPAAPAVRAWMLRQRRRGRPLAALASTMLCTMPVGGGVRSWAGWAAWLA